MKDFLTRNFTMLVILSLFIFLYVKGSLDGVLTKEAPRRDTVTTYIVGEGSTPAYQPPIVVTTPPTYIPEKSKPDTTYMGLLRQYQGLLNRYYSTNTYKDTIRLDTVGYVALEDSVRENSIISRKPNYSYKIPERTITVHEPYKPKIQGFAGGGVLFDPQYRLSGAQVGVGLKNKRDNMIMLNGYYQLQHGPSVGISYYNKISLKKK